MRTKHFLLTVCDDVEPELRTFETERDRDGAAALHRLQHDRAKRDGLFPLTLTIDDETGKSDLAIDTYSGEDSPCLLCGEPTFAGFCANPDCTQFGGLRAGVKVGVAFRDTVYGSVGLTGIVAIMPDDDDERVIVQLDAMPGTISAPRSDVWRLP